MKMGEMEGQIDPISQTWPSKIERNISFLALGIRARLRKKKPSLVCFSLHLLGSPCSSKKKREEIKV